MSIDALFSFLKGYRTYLSAAAALLTAIATVLGAVQPTTGMATAAALIAIAQIFQRVASSDHQLTLEEVAEDVVKFKDALKPLMRIAAMNSVNQPGPVAVDPRWQPGDPLPIGMTMGAQPLASPVNGGEGHAG